MANDYIIAINEVGEPFIAHAVGPRFHSQTSHTHKYKHKVRVGNGPRDFRYFYSEEEYQKYLEGEKRKQSSYLNKEQKKYDAIREYARLKKESERYYNAAQHARQKELTTLADKMSKKGWDLQKKLNDVYDRGYGKDSGGNLSDYNTRLFWHTKDGKYGY